MISNSINMLNDYIVNKVEILLYLRFINVTFGSLSLAPFPLNK